MRKKRDDLRPARDIHPSLQKYDKLTYEIKKIRNEDPSILPPSRSDSPKELIDLQEEYPGYVTDCSLKKGNMIIACYPPKLSRKLEFYVHPLITDTTFSVFEKGHYLCTSVIFSPQLQRHVVAFSAVLDGNTTEHFELYFAALFKAFTFPNECVGVVMDFSTLREPDF
ncbi:hypothetical protein BDB00DRAFT_405149 [Zychaea mexicana]|uniref:uncharacterized protein n=1 Tax=Zychaea mexicana TaxID=64656 RepID=UPI0022FEBB6B|nr:uncharacterized protein BDB00DRAFT_405149 [Zychaea mexicana]KAI9493011.1 hypothetical protein BDB00DRAFT_405149 [Zychaea mexicana]